jgi:hypothetical protein
MGAILGGGNNDAKAAAEKARREQQIANDRQLAQLAATDEQAGATRRNPRGRRLFAAAATSDKSDLS